MEKWVWLINYKCNYRYRSLVLTPSPPSFHEEPKVNFRSWIGNSLRTSHQIACPLCKYLGNVNSYSQYDFCAYVTLDCAQVRLCGLREKNLTNFPLVGLKNSKPLPTHQHTKMVGQLKIWVVSTQWIVQVSFSYVLYTKLQNLFCHLQIKFKKYFL